MTIRKLQELLNISDQEFTEMIKFLELKHKVIVIKNKVYYEGKK